MPALPHKSSAMRYLFILLLCLPLLAFSQVNRSANILARERVKEFVNEKIFKDLQYDALSYGELKAHRRSEPESVWIITHDFEISDSRYVDDQRIQVRTPHSFLFYLDKKMNVVGAASYARE